ncbi:MULTISPECIES: ribonuclease III [Flavobacteriaceae]|uniref:Ribonuclease 3 n=2 Tax=Flavobacteriaceae TaxID=49546 RepID=A0A4Y8ASV7_9FLAO|nr:MULTISPECIES: ribonuclease III [Flavobacteriaceae]TEW73752.1 ribonuclease III [Gramella jeungdoensis]GGK37300.1 ribonuclease 3 [Lutibacter litoralis]
MNFIRKIIDTRTKNDEAFYKDLKKIIGFNPKNLQYYKKAFIHRSIKEVDKKTGLPLNYERLEFLGDAMLSSVIASYLFQEVPSGDEGYLTKMRSKIVSREHLNELGKDLDLFRFVRSNVVKSKFGENIHGNIFEALIGAIYLDRGYTYCKKFVFKRVIIPYVDVPKLEGKITSYKSLFIEWCQKVKNDFVFEVYEDSGNDTIKHFSVKLFLDGKIIAKGRATSKKKAEETAAKRAYYAFQHEISNL